jgi:hypothetical protein
MDLNLPLWTCIKREMTAGLLTKKAVYDTEHEVHSTDDCRRDVVVVIRVATARHCCGGDSAAGDPPSRRIWLRPGRGQQRPRLQTRHHLPDTQRVSVVSFTSSRRMSERYRKRSHGDNLTSTLSASITIELSVAKHQCGVHCQLIRE